MTDTNRQAMVNAGLRLRGWLLQIVEAKLTKDLPTPKGGDKEPLKLTPANAEQMVRDAFDVVMNVLVGMHDQSTALARIALAVENFKIERAGEVMWGGQIDGFTGQHWPEPFPDNGADKLPGGWNKIKDGPIPAAITVQVCYFSNEGGEWVYDLCLSSEVGAYEKGPWTHWGYLVPPPGDK